MASYAMENLNGSDSNKQLSAAEQEMRFSEDRDQLSLAKVGKKQVLEVRFKFTHSWQHS